MAKKKGSNRYYDEEFKQDVFRLVDEGRPKCKDSSLINDRGQIHTLKWT